MKILIVAPQPFFSIRGTPMAVRELASVFLKLGNDVDILTLHLGEDISLQGLKIYRSKAFSRRIKYIPPGFSFKKLILDLLLLPKALLLIVRNKYDVVHCVEESAYFILWFKWLKPFLLVYDMDSDIPKQMEESGKIRTWFALKIIKEWEKMAIRFADAVVTICPVFTSKIKNLFPEKNVFQIEDVSISDEIPRVERNDHEKRILYTGNFEKYQGVEVLISAFKVIREEVKNAVLVLVGGEEEKIPKIGDEKIFFAGKRPVSEMPALLGDADILVSPRVTGENTPFKIYSYLASGKPILATNIISHTQVLTDGENALLADPTVIGLVNGLRQLLTNSDLAKRIGTGARKLFNENYTRDCYERKVRNYLNFTEEKVWEKKKQRHSGLL